jgi:hypothetical protein
MGSATEVDGKARTKWVIVALQVQHGAVRLLKPAYGVTPVLDRTVELAPESLASGSLDVGRRRDQGEPTPLRHGYWKAGRLPASELPARLRVLRLGALLGRNVEIKLGCMPIVMS